MESTLALSNSSRQKLFLVFAVIVVLITLFLFFYGRTWPEGMKFAILTGFVILRVGVRQFFAAKYRKQLYKLYPRPPKGSDESAVMAWQNSIREKMANENIIGKGIVYSLITTSVIVIWALILLT